jgi:hypothetical protein
MRAASLNLYLMRGATRLGVPRVAFMPHDERRGFAPRLGLGVACLFMTSQQVTLENQTPAGRLSGNWKWPTLGAANPPPGTIIAF